MHLNLNRNADLPMADAPIRWKDAEDMLKGVSAVWSLSKKANALVSSFKFKDYASALNFVNCLSKSAEKMNHHPDVSLGYGHVDISITTTNLGGLSTQDFELASAIDDDFISLNSKDIT
jgi:4a-hydroxytetrahydrobiopterin dehydratase